MSQTLKDLEKLLENRLFQLDVSIKFLGCDQEIIDSSLDDINKLKDEIEKIKSEYGIS